MLELKLIISMLILGYVLRTIYQEESLLVIPHNDKTRDTIFKCVSAASFVIVANTIIYEGLRTGLLLFLFTWCFSVVLTPMPESAILVTIPIKYLTKLPLERAHVMVSVLALVILYLFYLNGNNIVKKTSVSGVFNYITGNRLYHMFFLGIATSIMISKFINDAIDAHVQKDNIFLFNNTNKNLAILSSISTFMYLHTIHKYYV
jgi:hypothetical protein